MFHKHKSVIVIHPFSTDEKNNCTQLHISSCETSLQNQVYKKMIWALVAHACNLSYLEAEM
jgi:hypothetical protein